MLQLAILEMLNICDTERLFVLEIYLLHYIIVAKLPDSEQKIFYGHYCKKDYVNYAVSEEEDRART